MSRTRHARPIHSIHHMRVQNRRKSEAAALEAILEEAVSPRHINRLKSYWSQIPEPWDDKPHAAWREFHNKHYWKKWREELDAPRFTKSSAHNHHVAEIADQAIAAGIKLMIIDFSRCRRIVF